MRWLMRNRARGRPGRLFVVILAHLALTAALTGCERPPARRPTGKALPPATLIAVIGPSQANPSWKGIRGGARRFCQQRPGVECLTAAPENNEPESLAAVVERVFAKNPLAVCLCVEDPEIAEPVAQRIVGRSMILVTVGRRLENVGAYGHVAVDLPGAAELLGGNLDDIAGARLSYVLLHEDGRDRVASLCYTRFIAAARTKATLRLLEQRNAAADGRSQQELVWEMLRHFRHVGLVVTLNPQPWLSLQPRIRLPKENRFATLTAPPLLWPRLRSGEAAALAGPLDGEIGYAAVDLAVQGLMCLPDAQRTRVVRCELVTPETLADFRERYAAAANVHLAELEPLVGAPQPARRPGGD